MINNSDSDSILSKLALARKKNAPVDNSVNTWYKLIFFIVIGVLASCIVSKKMLANFVITTWPTVNGHVIYVKYFKGLLNRDMAKIMYEYPVDNVVYKNSSLRASSGFAYELLSPLMGDISMITVDTKSLIDAKYPIGKQVLVHYDPSNPHKACVETTLNPLDQ